MKNFVANGEVLDTVVGADTASGDLVAVGKLVGVAQASAKNGETVAVALCGVFTVPKASGAITQGAALYYDATAKNVTTTASGNTACGWAWAAAASGDTSVQLRLMFC